MRSIIPFAFACVACGGHVTKAPQSANPEPSAAAPLVPPAGSALPPGPGAVAAPPPEGSATTVAPAPGTFADDLAFLRKHTFVVVLGDEFEGAAVAVASTRGGS